MRCNLWILGTLAWVSLAGCDLDELFVSAGEGPTPIRDSSVPGVDGAKPGPVDAGGRQQPDGAVDAGTDAGADAGLDPSDPDYWSSCTLDDEAVARIPVPFSDASDQSLAVGATGFGIAHLVDVGCDEIFATPVEAFGPIPPGRPAVGQGECFAKRGLAMGRGADSWILAWVDNRTGSAELYAQHFDDSMTPLTGRLQISSDSRVESQPTLANFGQVPVVAYIASEGDTGSVHLQRLDQDGPATELMPASAGMQPTRLAVAQMGFDHGAVAWVSQGDKRGVFAQPIDNDGAAMGAPIRLSEFAAAGSTVDLATQVRGGDALRGGAAVYTTAHDGRSWQVRFRRFDGVGQPTAQERVLVDAPYRARDATITSVGDGYAIAFRALPDGGAIEEPQIRMLFATREGNIARTATGRPVTYEVARATETSSRITMRLSVEGQLLLSWLDFDPTSGQNVLKYARRRLNCE